MSSQPQTSEKILAIDDESSILSLLQVKLQSEGFQVMKAKRSEEAFEHLRRHSFLAILLDVSLSGENGLDILQEIKTINSDIPVIMVTGNFNEAVARQAIQLGAFDYITKPIQFDYLVNILSLQRSKT